MRELATIALGDLDKLTRTEQNELKGQLSDAMESMWLSITDDLSELAIYESGYYAVLIGSFADEVLSVPEAQAILNYISKTPMVLTSGNTEIVDTWTQLTRKNNNASTTAIINKIRAGYANGLTNAEIKKSITGTKKNKYTDGILGSGEVTKAGKASGKVTRDINTLIRTGSSFYNNSAREAVNRGNDDIIDGYGLVATLDNKTSDICKDRGGKFYANGNIYLNYTDFSKGKAWKSGPRPMLPFHYNERSVYIAAVGGDNPFTGTRPSVGAGKNYERGDEYKGKAQVDNGEFKISQVDADTTYSEFLKDQPFDFVADAFGSPTKAKLFIDGKLTIDKFTDAVGNPLTITELRERDSAAFKRAGI